MKDFHDLLAAALVGTSRRTLPTSAGTPLSDALNAIQDDPEGTLLSRAALAGLVNFSGQRPSPLHQAAPPPAPAELLPEAPSRFARHLGGLIGTPRLGEWLHLCAQAGWRVPPATLPALLDLARSDTRTREQLRPVLGERGAWLAQFNPDWRFFKGYRTPAAFNEEAWLDASETQKESMYRDLRGHTPETSREFLAQHFKTEKAGVRKRLLGVLQDTWTPQDAALEPLLEETLTDRSSDVQQLARTLLQHLPTSTYNARMAARAAAMLQHEKQSLMDKLRGKHKLSLHLPDTPDPDAGRDGLPTPDKDTKNPTHQRFRALLKGTHTHTLFTTLNITPEALVNLAAQVNGLDELTAAATSAQQRQVAQALLTQPEIQKNKYARIGLLLIAHPEHLTDEIRTTIRQNDTETLELMLEHLPAPWPPEVSRDLLNLLQTRVLQVTDYRSFHYALNRLLEQVTHSAHPDTPRPEPLPTDEENLDYYAVNARMTFNAALAGLQERQQLWKDFAEAHQ